MAAAAESATLVAPRVLSVQSHVVHGYVGNRSAVFPLQLLGFNVDVINSVQFSCHTGYGVPCGQKLGGEELRTLWAGLQANGVLNHKYLLTGYIGAVSFLREVIELRRALGSACTYLCDPVLGDNGKLYVPEDLVAVYRTEMLEHVSVLTPNQFEAQLLAETTIDSVQAAAAVCDKLHAMGPRMIVLTTLDVPDATLGGTHVAMMLSEAGRKKWLLRLPFVQGGPFTGTGDLTAAMLLAGRELHPNESPLALERAGATLQAVLKLTAAMPPITTQDGRRLAPELALIESRHLIEDPLIQIRCRLVEPLALQGVVIVASPGAETHEACAEFFGLPERGPPVSRVIAVPADGEEGEASFVRGQLAAANLSPPASYAVLVGSSASGREAQGMGFIVIAVAGLAAGPLEADVLALADFVVSAPKCLERIFG